MSKISYQIKIIHPISGVDVFIITEDKYSELWRSIHNEKPFTITEADGKSKWFMYGYLNSCVIEHHKLPTVSN